MTTALAERDPQIIDAALVTRTMEVLKTIRSFVASEMTDGLDYGVIPGTGTKKVMLLPGAQKVAMLYNAYPRYIVTTNELGGGHVEFRVTTELVNRSTDAIVGSGVGSCCTMESKFRYRKAARKCPACGKEAIIKGREEYGGGWLCFKKKDGCGAKFADDDKIITDQPEGRVEKDDIFDSRNTVLKMAKKRSMVDAAIGLGCLTELFTQDLDEEIQHPVQAPPITKPAQTQAIEAQEAADIVIRDWADWWTGDPSLTDLNRKKMELKGIADESLRKILWANLQAEAKRRNIRFDERRKEFDFAPVKPGEELIPY